MIKVIHSDDPRALEYNLFPEQHPSNLIYIQQNMQHFAETLNDSGRMFMEQHRQIYQTIDHEEIARKARNVMRSVRDMFRPDLIIPLETIEELQSAQLMMQRYIMAEPSLRLLYNANKCDGYDGTYLDVQPGCVEETHLDYRKVMTGAVIETDEGWVARQYYDDLFEGDKPLQSDERLAIRRTWDAVRLAISQGKDPTNPFGGDLGV